MNVVHKEIPTPTQNITYLLMYCQYTWLEQGAGFILNGKLFINVSWIRRWSRRNIHPRGGVGGLVRWGLVRSTAVCQYA